MNGIQAASLAITIVGFLVSAMNKDGALAGALAALLVLNVATVAL